jgi:hypothetical protein
MNDITQKWKSLLKDEMHLSGVQVGSLRGGPRISTCKSRTNLPMETAVGNTGPVSPCPIRVHFCNIFLPCWMEHSRTVEHCFGLCLQAEGNQFHHLVQLNSRTSTEVFTRQHSCSSVNYCVIYNY